MSIYDVKTMGDTVKDNSYAGRGIAAGMTADGSKAALAYFIMGRSENSRNRVFREEGKDVVIYPFDESKVEDPSLIIYSPLRVLGNKVIVTNGDQTDTIYDFMSGGGTFKEALETRKFEPDAPNLTPRISAVLTLDTDLALGACCGQAGGKAADGQACSAGDISDIPKFSYEMSILKSIDEKGSGCARYIYSYPAAAGLGHFIHTYEHDGNPLPTFQGEPRRIFVPDDMEEFFRDIWENLNEQNRISLYVRYIDLKTGESRSRLINKHE